MILIVCTWHLRRLLWLSYSHHVTNVEVLRLTCQMQLSTTLPDRRLRLFGHVARADSRMDHTCALRSIIATRLETTSRSTTTNLALYDWTGLAATRHRLGISLPMGSGLWMVEMDSGSGYASGWGTLLMMMIAFTTSEKMSLQQVMILLMQCCLICCCLCVSIPLTAMWIDVGL